MSEQAPKPHWTIPPKAEQDQMTADFEQLVGDGLKMEAMLALSKVRKELLQEGRMEEARLLREILLTTKEEPDFTLAKLLRRMVDSTSPPQNL